MRKARPAARAVIGIAALCDGLVDIQDNGDSLHTGDMKRRAAIECEMDGQLVVAIIVDVPGTSPSDVNYLLSSNHC